MDSQGKLAQDWLYAASTIKRWATTFKRHEPCLRSAGFTVIVHDEHLEPGDTPMAVDTTLPTRQELRILLAEALAQCLMKDGINPDNIAEVAAEDIAAYARRGAS